MRAAITRSGNEVWVSPIGVWELLVRAEPTTCSIAQKLRPVLPCSQS